MKGKTTMTPEEFNEWIADMKNAGIAASGSACGRMLDVSANSIGEMRKRGADKRTALACRALLHKLEPYGTHGEDYDYAEKWGESNAAQHAIDALDAATERMIEALEAVYRYTE